MQCPNCNSTHIRKNGNRRGNKITFMSIAVVNSLRIMHPLKAIQIRLNKTAWRYTSMAWGFAVLSGSKGYVTPQWFASWSKSERTCQRLPTRYYSWSWGTWWTRNFCWLEKNKIWIWTAVDHFRQRILVWVLGDHSAKTFAPLWAVVATVPLPAWFIPLFSNAEAFICVGTLTDYF